MMPDKFYFNKEDVYEPFSADDFPSQNTSLESARHANNKLRSLSLEERLKLIRWLLP